MENWSELLNSEKWLVFLSPLSLSLSLFLSNLDKLFTSLENRESPSFQVMDQGVGLSTDTDSELIAQMVAKAIALNFKCRNNVEDYGDISKVRKEVYQSIQTNTEFLCYTFN